MGPQRGFARETLGEPFSFKLWQTGHNKNIGSKRSLGYQASQLFDSDHSFLKFRNKKQNFLSVFKFVKYFLFVFTNMRVYSFSTFVS